jgi:hypothetical protein
MIIGCIDEFDGKGICEGKVEGRKDEHRCKRNAEEMEGGKIMKVIQK